MRVVWNMLFGLVLALLLGYREDAALAQDTFEPLVEFVVDGDWRDWRRGRGPSRSDGHQDVAPDSNSSIDITQFDYITLSPHYGHKGRHGKFSFIFQFLAPPFQDSTQTSVELFFDVSADSTFGEATPPWINFLPDYRLEIVGQNGHLTKEVYSRWVEDQWVVTEGEGLSEVEVVLSGQWLEGFISWAALGNPGDSEEEEKRGYYTFKWAVKTTQDGYHDYLPDGDRYFYDPWGPAGPPEGRVYTAVGPQSWGSIKNDQSQGGLD